jgi:methionine-rich copper-binding protein CopC
LRLLAATTVALAFCPSAAWAHAQLLSTSPADNAVVAHEPAAVEFTFGESVGIDGEAVRVFDHDGRRVDAGRSFHPGGRGPTVGVHLRSGLPHGTFTATYRVVSADTHIVTGGLVFSIGARSGQGAATLSHLLARQRSGPISDTAFAAARGVQYAAIGIAAGLFAFLLLIWSAALERAGPPPDAWRTASTRYLLRVQTILAGCCVAGLVSDHADISSVRIKLPTGVLSALGDPPPGWSSRARTHKLAKPIKTPDGVVSTEQGSVISFPTVQTYSNGASSAGSTRPPGSAWPWRGRQATDIGSARVVLLDSSTGYAATRCLSM